MQVNGLVRRHTLLVVFVVLVGCNPAAPSSTPVQPTGPVASPTIECSASVPAGDCESIVAAALSAVPGTDGQPIAVWVNSGILCPAQDCLFDPAQNFPFPPPPASGQWVAGVEVAFAGRSEHAGIQIARVGNSLVPKLIGYRTPQPGWCSGSCDGPPPTSGSSVP